MISRDETSLDSCSNSPVIEDQHAKRYRNNDNEKANQQHHMNGNAKRHSLHDDTSGISKDPVIKSLRMDMSSFTQTLFNTFAFNSFLQVAASNVRSSWTTELPIASLGCSDYSKSHLPNVFEVPIKPDGHSSLSNDQLDEYISRASNQVVGEEQSSDFPENAATINQAPTVSSKTAAVEPVSSTVSSMLPAPLAKTVPRFTWENISASVDAMNTSRERGYFSEHRFLRFMGRPTTATYLTALDISSTNAVERRTVFMTQRVIHILSDVDCLLASFRTPPYAQAVDDDPSRVSIATTSFIYIWVSFFLILELGGYGSIISSCLHSSLRKVERYSFVFNLAKPLIPPCTPFQLPHSVDDSGIVHIATIVVAALVAFVPVCSPETWISICERRSQGRVSHEARFFSNDLSSQEIIGTIDSLEDERLLSLTRQLIRMTIVYSGRRRIASNQHTEHHVQEKSAVGAENSLLDLLMDHKFTKDHCEIAAKTFGDITPESCWSHACFTILELLRTVLLKEWDGSAVVSKTGLVAGAADCMNVLCRATPNNHHQTRFSNILCRS